jgi:hypothetical protein
VTVSPDSILGAYEELVALHDEVLRRAWMEYHTFGPYPESPMVLDVYWEQRFRGGRGLAVVELMEAFQLLEWWARKRKQTYVVKVEPGESVVQLPASDPSLVIMFRGALLPALLRAIRHLESPGQGDPPGAL